MGYQMYKIKMCSVILLMDGSLMLVYFKVIQKVRVIYIYIFLMDLVITEKDYKVLKKQIRAR